MSGITPLLDTLLHQVLGKRVDTPPPRDLNQPVKPTSPAEAPRALHSDSRLDARPGAASSQRTHRTSPQPPPDPALYPRQEGTPPTSSQTHLSSAGRTIADLLMRFPAPPSTLSTRAPLVTTGQAADPAQVAARLEGSVRDSGLFYESHLNRWYKGELPRQQLEREPQMWRTLRFSPSAAPGAAETRLLARPLPPAGGPPQATPPAADPGSTTPPTPAPSVASPAPAPAGTSVPTSEATGRPAQAGTAEPTAMRPPALAARDPVHESLQGIVRHQLEMLVTPTLRWEGDVWSGLFMALLIQPPVGERASRDEEQEAPPGEDARRTWRSDIDLEVQGAGRVKASVWMQDTRLEIDMRVADPETLTRLQEGRAPLEARLGAHGFEEVGVTLERLTTEAADGPP